MSPFLRQLRVMPERNAGFSLVEIMVGMVIGLLGIIVMMNLFSNFEAQKRTTTGGSEVQNDGAISLFTIQQDIEQAGYGINTKDTTAHPLMYGCSVSVPLSPNPAYPPVAFTIPAIAPVTINSSLIGASGVDANTDTLLVVYGNGNEQPEGEIIASTGASAVVATTFNTKFQPPDAQSNDQVIFEQVARPTPCALSVDTVVVGPPSTTSITLNTGVTSASIPVVPNNIGTMFNLGNMATNHPLTVMGYAIRGGNLTACDYMRSDCANPPANWSPIANGIVSMKALYGRDISGPPMDGIVDTYDQATPNPASPTYACDWMRISSIRLALVGRNSQPNKNAVTTTAPTWTGATANPINLTASTTGTFDWTHYRYKVFQTTVPIRNIILNGVIPGC